MSDTTEGQSSSVENPEDLAPADPRDEAILRAETEMAQLRERLLRMAADQDNFQKRQARERDQAVQFANEQLVLALVPSIDNFDRLLTSPSANTCDVAFLDGVRLV